MFGEGQKNLEIQDEDEWFGSGEKSNSFGWTYGKKIVGVEFLGMWWFFEILRCYYPNWNCQWY